jgi:hypothetical protein
MSNTNDMFTGLIDRLISKCKHLTGVDVNPATVSFDDYPEFVKNIHKRAIMLIAIPSILLVSIITLIIVAFNTNHTLIICTAVMLPLIVIGFIIVIDAIKDSAPRLEPNPDSFATDNSYRLYLNSLKSCYQHGLTPTRASDELTHKLAYCYAIIQYYYDNDNSSKSYDHRKALQTQVAPLETAIKCITETNEYLVNNAGSNTDNVKIGENAIMKAVSM